MLSGVQLWFLKNCVELHKNRDQSKVNLITSVIFVNKGAFFQEISDTKNETVSLDKNNWSERAEIVWKRENVPKFPY